MRNTITTVLKGFCIGSTMTVPGISGGTMAIAVNIYDRLISAVSNFFIDPKKNIIFLLKFCLGAGLGFFLISKFITSLLNSPFAGLPLRFFFLGAIAGGIPLIFRKTNVKRITPAVILCPLAGIASVVLITMLPAGLFSSSDGISGFILQLLAGFIIAVALVLPGISASHMLLMLGIYESIIDSISKFDIPALIAPGAGLVLGTFLTARALDKLLNSHVQGTYLVILGFMAGSIPELFPAECFGAPIYTLLFCVICAFIGFIVLKKVIDIAEDNSDEGCREN